MCFANTFAKYFVVHLGCREAFLSTEFGYFGGELKSDKMQTNIFHGQMKKTRWRKKKVEEFLFLAKKNAISIV